MVFLAKHPMVDDYDLSSLTDLVCAAAPLSEQLENEVRTRLNNDKLKFRQGNDLNICQLYSFARTDLTCNATTN